MPTTLILARVDPARYPELQPVSWPEYKTAGASGLDLCADVGPEGVVVPAHLVVAIPTGLIMQIPSGYEGQIRPRSGTAFKNWVSVINSPGTIDADFRGEVVVGLVNHGAMPFMVNRGDRLAQLVIGPVVRLTVVYAEASELSVTARGAGAFGSTGINDKPHPSLVSLTPEELAKIPSLKNEDIQEALDKGKCDADACVRRGVSPIKSGK